MPYTIGDIRNVCLVGPSNSGKTTLTEALLEAGGKIKTRGSVEKGDTVSDFTKHERQSGHSLYPSICHLDHGGIHVNLIDTPGYRDFFGRALAVLPAVETAAIVINAESGIEQDTRRLMKAAHNQRLCRILVVNKIDAEGVDLEALMEQIRTEFGAGCLPLNLPAAEGVGVVDCFFQPEGAETKFSDVKTAHTQIVDQVVEVDDELMELYLEQGEDLQPDQLHEPFEEALREEHLTPVCFVSAQTGAGIKQLLQIFERLMPNPAEGNPPVFLKGEGDDAEEVALNPDPDAHAIAHVFHVEIDAFKGRLGVFRLHQGTIKAGGQLFVGDARKPIKVNQLLKLNGGDHSRVEVALPGDICAIPRVDEIHYGAVLHDSHDEDHFQIKSIDLPRPMFGLAISPPTDNDAQKTSDALHTAEAEDPSIKVEHNAALNEIVLRGLGEMHLRTILEEIKDRYDLDVKTAPPSIAYRETIRGKAEGHHRHKKQTGGAGQFGEVYLRIRPLGRGEGFEFKNAVVGGAIPTSLIPAVEKGIRQIIDEGAIAGYQLQDMEVEVYDGKHHPVDSKEIAFVIAARHALLDAIRNAGPQILEPIVSVDVTVPEANMGDITGNLAGRRARISGTESLTGGLITVQADMPLSSLSDYHAELNSMTQGQGSFTMEFSHYDPVPHQVQQELESAYKPKADD